MGVRYGVTEKTARLFMLKVREAIASSGNNHMDGDVNVDEFVLGSRETKMTTDKWRGYGPIAKAFDIIQIENNKGLSFKALHTMIRQIKSWIRTTYSCVSDDNLNTYFNEFCFRINRSQTKATIFTNLMMKMVKGDKIYQRELISN